MKGRFKWSGLYIFAGLFEMRIILSVILTMSYCQLIAQQSQTMAEKYFNKANDALQTKKYAVADSLYTLSLYYGDFAENYYNRGLARIKLGNREGFCNDMGEAAKYGDTLALDIHIDSCGVRRNLFFDQSMQPCFDSLCVYKLHVEGSTYLNQYYYTLTNYQNDTLDEYLVYNRFDTIRHDTKFFKQAMFPGGANEFGHFLNDKYYFPVAPPRYGSFGATVVVLFTVSPEGGIYNIRALDEMPFWTDEAMRLTRLFPRFKPATLNGKPVKSVVRMIFIMRSYGVLCLY